MADSFETSTKRTSLPPGRNQSSLDEAQKAQVEQAFRGLGYQGKLEFREGPGTKSGFVPNNAGEPCIVIGADIFPGKAMNPNAMMDMLSAAAHEISHHSRWTNSWEHREFEHLDEAVTSLQAACWSKQFLSPSQIESLVSDAIERLGLLNEQIIELKKNAELKDNAIAELSEKLRRLGE